MKNNKKAEIGTIVMMAFLVLVSVVAFGSSKFLPQTKTTATKAATSYSCPTGTPQNCGSGNRYCCDPNEGYDSSKTGSNLEFACCVADKHQEDDTYRIGWYGYTGQPCSNTKIGGTYLGHLVGCVGGQEALSSQEGGRGRYSLNGNAVVFSPAVAPIIPPSDPACVRPTITGTGRGSLSCPTGMPLNRDTGWCCPVAGMVIETPMPSETPTPSISCRFQQATCSNGSKFDYYKLISSDCTGSNLNKLCYGTEVGQCNLYNWENVWENKCNNISLPTAVPPVATGTTSEDAPAAIETLTPIPPTPILTPGECQQIGCSSINPLDSDIADLWIKTTGLQNNYFKKQTDCDSNMNSNFNVADYCKNQTRSLTFNVQLNIVSQLNDAKPNTQLSLHTITNDSGYEMSLLEKNITNNFSEPQTLSFSGKRYNKYNVEFCYEINELIYDPYCQYDCPITYKLKCLYGNGGYKTYSEVISDPTFTIDIGQ